MTKEEILDKMDGEMPWGLNDKAFPYIKEAMEIYKDQELSLLTEKYETQKHNAYFLLNQSNDWEEKYNKLKEAFEELLNNMLDHRFNKRSITTIEEYEKLESKWSIKAGLKEQ